jgi:hypothetical protein
MSDPDSTADPSVQIAEALICQNARQDYGAFVKARNADRIVDFYLLAKSIVLDGGFAHEIEWQSQIRFADLDEPTFLQEAAWVVLSAGMRESVIRSKFAAFSLAFYSWSSARQIALNDRKCRTRALRVFRHSGKIDSIISIAKVVHEQGFDIFKSSITSDGLAFLQALPFIGPTTSFHLGKNIGLDVVKPDRHLLRVSMLAGYSNPTEMCRAISDAVGDRASVVDLIVWRYATLNPGYRDFLARYLH